MRDKLPKILEQPAIPTNLTNPQWLSGEGAGSWFTFEFEDENLTVNRFSPEGVFECRNLYKIPEGFNPNTNFEITYPSHCSVITLSQNNQIFNLTNP